MAKTFGIVAVLTVLSKFAGLARDVIVGARYGTGVISDAYQSAYMLTGNFLILLGGLGGPFHTSTVAVVGHKKDDEDAGALVAQVLVITILLMAALSVVTYLLGHFFFVPLWTATYTGAGVESAELKRAFADSTIQQLDIMLPMIVIAGIIGVVYGVLNIFNKVACPSISPAIASIAIIVALFLFNDPSSGLPLAIGTLVGAVGQLIVQLPAFFTTGFKYSLPFKPHPELKKYLMMLLPSIVATEIGQIVTYVDNSFANSTGAGSWTAIVNANRLVQLPLGVLLTAMLVPVLPRFTEQVKDNRLDDLTDDLRRALRVLWFLGLPLSAIMLALPGEIITVLFQRGQWTEYSTMITAAALIPLCPYIFFYLARDLITRVFYAFRDATTPFRVAIVTILVKTFLDYTFVIILAPRIAPSIQAHLGLWLPTSANTSWSLAQAQQICGIAGISVATWIVTIVNLALLTWLARKRVGLLGFRLLISPVAVMLVASALCFGATLGAYRFSEHYLPASNLRIFTGVAIASVAGLLVYLLTCVAAKLEEPHTVAKRLPLIRRLVP
jgi:putative peptidoglycan lipid II flippase